MTREEYDRNIRSLEWAKKQVEEAIALLSYRDDSMLKIQTNKNRIICGLDTAIENLETVQEEILQV
ncbi:MAG: hypothetical protein IJX81_01330 [Clostridia bacterium]|nr:hypothetical protein [Clostridia bacterium]